ncbi:two-component system sensor histidine kinase NtrB [Acidovorax sp. NCPPB 4044]|uniref:two-component system sensor histidine kinase NtrB n=1 Tax=Acidovorax sp. NCPPB 4044 TaxID=2940490 RepID=UPI0023023C31|nr:PAS domain-containing sensor histidine kinase [Acidovorax sp. NCPPB 4044]MDA8519339.1 PAS domain-containing sensor histidine kinase [Acidovorax sp. NCPPB 4044]
MPPPSRPLLPPTLQAPAADPPFLRLWTSFLAGRVLVAVALLLLQALGFAFNQNFEPVLAAVCILYLVATVLVLSLSAETPPPPQAGIRWLPTIGVDLAVIISLQMLQSGGMNFTPLFGLPILMAGVLGTLTLALGTTAGATLLLLAWAWWLGGAGTTESAQRYFQTALTGTGYFIVAYLVHQLATRLHREQQLAEESHAAAKIQEQVSALVIDHLSDGVLVVDPRGTVRLANPAALVLLADSLRPALPFALTHSPSWKPLLEMARQTFVRAQPQSADVDILQTGQSPLALRVRAWLTSSPQIARDTGGAQLCVMFLHDLREMEARLRTEKLAAMGRMSAAVAHEIRNPLAAIVQANALLEEDLVDPAQRRLAQMVQQNADRLARIAEDVLDIARVQHQISHAPAGVLPLDDTVAQVCKDWQSQAPGRRRAQLSLHAEGSPVEFDPEHLRRVLVNLLDNALRYMGTEADSLCVSTYTNASGQAHLQVWSDGAPLDKSVERHLFEPFFSSESRSSGLGLYICRELCQRHGASIDYQRLTRVLPRGAVGGNGFTVAFRRASRPAGPATLFDTIVV